MKGQIWSWLEWQLPNRALSFELSKKMALPPLRAAYVLERLSHYEQFLLRAEYLLCSLGAKDALGVCSAPLRIVPSLCFELTSAELRQACWEEHDYSCCPGRLFLLVFFFSAGSLGYSPSLINIFIKKKKSSVLYFSWKASSFFCMPGRPSLCAVLLTGLEAFKG